MLPGLKVLDGVTKLPADQSEIEDEQPKPSSCVIS